MIQIVTSILHTIKVKYVLYIKSYFLCKHGSFTSVILFDNNVQLTINIIITEWGLNIPLHVQSLWLSFLMMRLTWGLNYVIINMFISNIHEMSYPLSISTNREFTTWHIMTHQCFWLMKIRIHLLMKWFLAWPLKWIHHLYVQTTLVFGPKQL